MKKTRVKELVALADAIKVLIGDARASSRLHKSAIQICYLSSTAVPQDLSHQLCDQFNEEACSALMSMKYIVLALLVRAS